MPLITVWILTPPLKRILTFPFIFFTSIKTDLTKICHIRIKIECTIISLLKSFSHANLFSPHQSEDPGGWYNNSLLSEYLETLDFCRSLTFKLKIFISSGLLIPTERSYITWWLLFRDLGGRLGYRGSTKEFPPITVYLCDYSGTVQTADPGQTPENAAPDQGLPYTRNPFNKDKWTHPITKDGRVHYWTG